MGCRTISDGYHPAERKNGDFAAPSGCHPTERSWMESLSRACMTTPCPTAGWPPVTWKGSGTHVPHRSSRSSPCSRLLLDCASDPLAVRLANGSPILLYFYFYFFSFIYLKCKTVKII
ncbi:unnamed protein product [Spirodela intermedia]|uniref:Uncharacterized protein n=1 Tax=Spirodela intermedia TaxID=51605 RepID=A0ABN7E9U4_SPIIN|nr:unnamed protein product [Spirodela intermedia]